MRSETKIVIPPREETVTARVQAEFSPETRELLIISRGVAELRVEVPPAFAPAKINWNGNPLGGVSIRQAGPEFDVSAIREVPAPQR
jgi:hypothetical protein